MKSPVASIKPSLKTSKSNRQAGGTGLIAVSRLSSRRSEPNQKLGESLWPMILVVICVILLGLGKSQPQLLTKFNLAMAETTAPFYRLAFTPFQFIHQGQLFIKDWQSLSEENIALQNKLAEYSLLENQLESLKLENIDLSKLLHFERQDFKQFLSARVIHSGGPWLRSYVLDRGANDGVKLEMIAVDGLGVVGRVVELGETTSRILLINDVNSRIPVIAEALIKESNERGTDSDNLKIERTRFILAGDNGRLAKLNFFPESAQLIEGARVITSGDGESRIPQGLTVGTLVRVNTMDFQNQDQPSNWRVKLASEIKNLDIVQLIEY